MKNKTILPPACLCTAIIVMLVLHLLLPLIKYQIFPWNLLGLIPLGLGVVFNLVADAAFKKADTTVKPFEKSTLLITDGVFRVSRNPMYLGFILMLSGIALLLESLSPFLMIPVFFVVIQIYYIRAEERMLEETFQDGWASYTKQVRRWI